MIATMSVPDSMNGTDSQPKTVTAVFGTMPRSSSTRSTGVCEPGANVGAACGIRARSSRLRTAPRPSPLAAGSTTQTNRSRNSSARLPGKS